MLELLSCVQFRSAIVSNRTHYNKPVPNWSETFDFWCVAAVYFAPHINGERRWIRSLSEAPEFHNIALHSFSFFVPNCLRFCVVNILYNFVTSENVANIRLLFVCVCA